MPAQQRSGEGTTAQTKVCPRDEELRKCLACFPTIGSMRYQEDSVDEMMASAQVEHTLPKTKRRIKGRRRHQHYRSNIPPHVRFGGALSPCGNNKCKSKQNIWRELDNKESSIQYTSYYIMITIRWRWSTGATSGSADIGTPISIVSCTPFFLQSDDNEVSSPEANKQFRPRRRSLLLEVGRMEMLS